MSVQIHPHAIVEDGAELGENVVVEAFSIVGSKAKIGDGCRILHHSTVEGRVALGKNNTVYPYAMIGGLTHDLKYQGGDPGLRIGDDNVFREYVTAHVATEADDETVIGSNNVFLAYSHVAHDCIIGNHLVMSSHSALAGHVEVGDHVNVAWGAGLVVIAWFRLVRNWFRTFRLSCLQTGLPQRCVQSIRSGWNERASPVRKLKRLEEFSKCFTSRISTVAKRSSISKMHSPPEAKRFPKKSSALPSQAPGDWPEIGLSRSV